MNAPCPDFPRSCDSALPGPHRAGQRLVVDGEWNEDRAPIAHTGRH